MTDLGDMMALIRDHEPVPQCELRCGLAIYQWLRNRPAPVLNADRTLAPLTGIPIRLDPRMHAGSWSYTEDGEEVKTGRVGNGERVWYLPIVDQFVTTEHGPLIEILDRYTPEPEPIRMSEPTHGSFDHVARYIPQVVDPRAPFAGYSGSI